VTNLCKAGHAECGADRRENVTRLIREINHHKTNYMRILDYVVSPLAAIPAIFALYWGGGCGITSALEKERVYAGLFLSGSAVVGILSAIVFKNAHQRQRRSETRAKAARKEKVRKWYNTIKNVTGDEEEGRRRSKRTSKRKRAAAVRKSSHRASSSFT
jgi:hypothetical protein